MARSPMHYSVRAKSGGKEHDMTDPKNGKGGFSEFAKKESGISGTITPAAAPSPVIVTSPPIDQLVPKPMGDARPAGAKPLRH
jgi:hypothetical protein